MVEQVEDHIAFPPPGGLAPEANEFFVSLIREVASRYSAKQILQVIPDGAALDSAALRAHRVREKDYSLRLAPSPVAVPFVSDQPLSTIELPTAQVELSELPESLTPGSLLVSTLDFGGRPAQKSRDDEVVGPLQICASRLTDSDTAVFLTPTFFRTFTQGKLAEALAEIGVYVQAIIFPPAKILQPFTALRPTMVVVSKKIEECPVAFDCQHYEDLDLRISEVLSGITTTDIRRGCRVDLQSFLGPQQFAMRRSLESLASAFSNYEFVPISDVSTAIHFAESGGSFEDLKNAIYFPLIGKSPVRLSFDDLQMKHQNYAQIIFDPAKIDPWFMKSFLDSTHFRALVNASVADRVIPMLNRMAVRKFEIVLPDIVEQQAIGSTLSKLESLLEVVERIKTDVALNPQSIGPIAERIEGALESFGQLSKADQVYSIIRQGESKTIELKQTFALDISDNTKKEFLETTCIKTIAAFMNSDGGDLLVGVTDDGEITGLRVEIEKLHRASQDKFLLNLKNRIKSRIGEQVYPIINYELVSIQGNPVLHVNCDPSDTEVFVDGEDFYVRTNPATDKLTGPKLTEYTRKRFST